MLNSAQLGVGADVKSSMRRILPVLLMIVPLFLLARTPQDPPQKKGPMTPKNLKVLPPDTDIRATMRRFPHGSRTAVRLLSCNGR